MIHDSMLDLLARYGFCPWCLAIKNAQTIVVARTPVRYVQKTDGATMTVYDTRYPHQDGVEITNPNGLITWLHKQLGEHLGAVDFEIDQTQHRFVPVAIFDGTPVCPVDLWWLTERNWRSA
jgi:hypothetical protein